jgi:opacity protein-like surface antigen
MIRVIIFFFLITVSLAAKGQEFNSAFHIGWNTLVPFSDKDFTGSTSTAGVRLGYSKFVDERFGFGFEAGYSTLDDYVPPTTYEYPGGAITTDIYNYLYYFTVMANGQYYFSQGKRFMPYTSLGMGVAFSEYRIFYNVYQEGDNNTGFVIRPEIGTLFKVKENSSFGLKAAFGFEYATNKSEYFETENLSGFNFQLGFVLLSR